MPASPNWTSEVTVTTESEEIPRGVHANVVDCYGEPYNPVERR